MIGATVMVVWLIFLLFRPWWNPTTDAFVAIPILYALSVVGALLTVFLLAVRVMTVASGRLRWMIAGLAVAGTAVLFQAVVIADLANVPELVTPSGAAALYWLWHAALALFALGAAIAPDFHRLRQVLTVLFAAAVGLILFEPAWELLPAIVDGRGNMTALHAPTTAVLIVLTVGAVGAWVVACGRRATRPDVWLVVMLVLAAMDLLYSLQAGTWQEFVWWNSGPLRCAQFLAPAAGLLVDNARMVGLLRRHERGLQEHLDREVDLATRQLDTSLPNEQTIARIRTVLVDKDYRTVFQPIVSLSSGGLLAVEALTRFNAEPIRTPDRWFNEAHTVGLGVELELSVLETAMAAARGLPADVAVSVNLSPVTLLAPRLMSVLEGQARVRPLIIELTEHAPIDDYAHLDGALIEMRRLGARLAIDDAGAGFASLRHVVRLNPDYIKLDMSLTRGIHLDPVRRALARSLAEFARQTGAILVAEGIEEAAELTVLKALGVHAGQGYLLCRPMPVENLPSAMLGGHRAHLANDGSSVG